MTESVPPNVDDTAWRRHQDLYSSVGQAISMWASMESEVIEIAAILLGTTEQKTGLVFYSIMNFFSWLTIIDQLFTIDFKYSGHKPGWGKCAETLKALNDTRVRLAHHTVWDKPLDDSKPATIGPGRYDTRSKWREQGHLNEDEIIIFTAAVLDVSDKLKALLRDLHATMNSPQPSLGTLFSRLDDQRIQEEIPIDVLSAALKAPPQSSGQ